MRKSELKKELLAKGTASTKLALHELQEQEVYTADHKEWLLQDLTLLTLTMPPLEMEIALEHLLEMTTHMWRLNEIITSMLSILLTRRVL